MEKTTVYAGYASSSALTATPLDRGVNDLDKLMQGYTKSYPTIELPKHDNKRQDGYKNIKRRKMPAAIVGEVKDGKRNDDNVLNRTVLPLDLDSISESITDRESLSERLSALLGAKMYIFPSLGCNYANKGLRYHVWVPLSRAVNRNEYQLLISYYNQLLKEKGVITQIDRSNKSWSQLNGLPAMTKYTPEADRAELVLTVPGDLLDTDAALEPARVKAAKSATPPQQADKAAAEQYLKDKNAVDVVTDFAQRNQQWLSTYNNFLGAYFAIKGAEAGQQISHDEALRCVRALAGNDTAMAEENAEKYEHDHHNYPVEGLSLFVQASQVSSQTDWVTIKHGHAVASADMLGDEIMKKFPVRYNAKAIGDGGAIWLNGRWKSVNVEAIICNIADQMAKKAGVWAPTLSKNVLNYIKNNNPATRWESNKFDNSNPRLVQFRNGTLSLDTMQLEPSKAENLIPVSFDYDWNPDLKEPARFCQHWQDMIAELTGDDGDAVNTIYRYLGYTFERSYRHQNFIVLLGQGNNGKSYFINLIKNFIIGNKNVSAVSLERLASDTARFSSALLYHKSMNLFSDISSSFLQSTSAVKNLTGDDSTTAEFKGQDGFQFLNFAKLLFSANELPPFKDDSKGFSRRPRVIEFVQDFDDEATLAHFQKAYPKDVLKQEAQAFRQLCINEYHMNMNNKKKCFPESGQMKAARLNWFSIANTTSSFFDEMTKYSDLAKNNNIGESPMTLYQIYQDWAMKNGVKSLSRPNFEQKLKNRYPDAVVKRVRKGGSQIRRWCGLTFTEDAFTFLDENNTAFFNQQNKNTLYGYLDWSRKQF